MSSKLKLWTTSYCYRLEKMSLNCSDEKRYTAAVELVVILGFLGQFQLHLNLARTLQDRNTEVTVFRRSTAVSLERKHLLVRYGYKILAP